MIEDLDWQSLGTAVAILAKSNPIVAVATGVVTGILGKTLFDKKKQSKQERLENQKVIEKILSKKEQDASETE